MNKILKGTMVLLFLTGYKMFAQLQLTQPISSVQRSFVDDELILSYDFRMYGSTIRYTINGKSPNTNSKTYSKPIKIKKSCEVRAKVFHEDFLSSEASISYFYKKPRIVFSLEGTPPHSQYSGNGLVTLYDNVLGNTNFTEKYLGYNSETISLTLEPKERKKVKNIYISFLINQSSWIFGPTQIDVYQSNTKIFSTQYKENLQQKNTHNQIVKIPLVVNFDHPITLKIYSAHKIPDWHEGAGNIAWIFIDEIWVE